jgi:acyl carrier protein
MSLVTFEQELRAFIAQTTGAGEHRITETTPLAELGVDSLSAVEIVCWVEKRLQIEIPETTVQRVRTVGDILATVEQANRGFQPMTIPQSTECN